MVCFSAEGRGNNKLDKLATAATLAESQAARGMDKPQLCEMRVDNGPFTANVRTINQANRGPRINAVPLKNNP